MNANDIAPIINVMGLALALTFQNPFGRRPPRNRKLGALGYLMMFGSAVYQLWSKFLA